MACPTCTPEQACYEHYKKRGGPKPKPFPKGFTLADAVILGIATAAGTA